MRNELTVQELQDRVEVEMERLVASGETFTATTVTNTLRAAAPGDSIPHLGMLDGGQTTVHEMGVRMYVHQFMDTWMALNPGQYEVYTSTDLSAPHMAEHYRKVVTPAALPDPTPAVVTVQAAPVVVWDPPTVAQ